MTARRHDEIKSMYQQVGPFREELAQTRDGDRWFHIHRDGSPAYSQRFDHVDSFHEGFAVVRV